jgi:hypothetical protein
VILPEAKTYSIVLLNTEGADSYYFSDVVSLEGRALLNGKPPVGAFGYGPYGGGSDDDDGVLDDGVDNEVVAEKTMHGTRKMEKNNGW